MATKLSFIKDSLIFNYIKKKILIYTFLNKTKSLSRILNWKKYDIMRILENNQQLQLLFTGLECSFYTLLKSVKKRNPDLSLC